MQIIVSADPLARPVAGLRSLRRDIQPPAELFRVNVLTMLDKEGVIADAFLNMIMLWRLRLRLQRTLLRLQGTRR